MGKPLQSKKKKKEKKNRGKNINKHEFPRTVAFFSLILCIARVVEIFTARSRRGTPVRCDYLGVNNDQLIRAQFICVGRGG